MKSLEPEKGAIPAGTYPQPAHFHSVVWHRLQLRSLSKLSDTGQCHFRPLPARCHTSIAVSHERTIAHFDFIALGRWDCLFKEREDAGSLWSHQFSHACRSTEAGEDCFWQFSCCKHQTCRYRMDSIAYNHMATQQPAHRKYINSTKFQDQSVCSYTFAPTQIHK